MNLITLKNKNEMSLIKDIITHPLKINKDESGMLVETLRTDWEGVYGPDKKFFMQYYSITPSGLARDEDVWHYHPTVQDDRFIVVQGEIVVAVADNRENSLTKGMLNLFYMQAEKNPYILLIPRKTLHGFLVVSQEPAILLNFPTALYDPKEEGRISHKEAQVKDSAGNLFNWRGIREKFRSETI